MITFNPELAPQDMLFEQAEMIEKLPREDAPQARGAPAGDQGGAHPHHDQRPAGLPEHRPQVVHGGGPAEIRGRKIGYGKIGGKSAGHDAGLPHPAGRSRRPRSVTRCAIPVSYFLASDLFYTFMATNGLMHWCDQKYKPEAMMRAEYPQIVREFVDGDFPEDILDRLRHDPR